MLQQIILLSLSCSAMAHLVATCVMAVYARHKIQYLCLAWINGIFTFALFACTFFSQIIAEGDPGVLHPAMLIAVMSAIFLQSIYPLSIPMPGFLQWGRMWAYARPAIAIIGIYSISYLLGARFVHIGSLADVAENLLTSDILLRLTALGICVYYIVNIFRLPHQMAQNTTVPRYMLGYSFVLGLSLAFYAFITVYYSPILEMIYVGIFTLLNLYLVLRVLETMAISLPNPVLKEVQEEPAEEELKQAEGKDFNEANLQRFQRIQFWMQNHREEWTESSFGRDRLCEQVGFNRHIVLQSVRSQGFNNVHDYITHHRINELKRQVRIGKITTVQETSGVGFASTKTARSCFEKVEGSSLDDFIRLHQKG